MENRQRGWKGDGDLSQTGERVARAPAAGGLAGLWNWLVFVPGLGLGPRNNVLAGQTRRSFAVTEAFASRAGCPWKELRGMCGGGSWKVPEPWPPPQPGTFDSGPKLSGEGPDPRTPGRGVCMKWGSLPPPCEDLAHTVRNVWQGSEGSVDCGTRRPAGAGAPPLPCIPEPSWRGQSHQYVSLRLGAGNSPGRRLFLWPVLSLFKAPACQLWPQDPRTHPCSPETSRRAG